MFVFVTTDKLKEFNEKVGAENQLSTAELDSLQTLMEGKDVTDVHISNVSKVLDWPTGNSSFLYHIPLPCAMVFASSQVLPIFFFFKSDFNTLLAGFSLAFLASYMLA